ncbi:MAG TPA: hypothetical protein VFP84_34915 [Kofleriaceae bacterium]|nr:hypothetical protein [Kofleriaceae bacterium]
MTHTWISIAGALGALTACGARANDDRAGHTDGGAPTAARVECAAQRAVYLVGGRGGLASFTLAWPAPAVIDGFAPGYAYDSPGRVASLGSPAHPLFVRTIGAPACGLWQGSGRAPQPTAFVVGDNETHRDAPTSVVISPRAGGLIADGAVIQRALAPVIPVVIFLPAGPYGTAADAPAPVMVNTVAAAVAAFAGKIPTAQQAALVPSAAQLARYVPAGVTPSGVEKTLATQLAFAANAFALGVVGSVVLPALGDDPHTLFDAGGATARADDVAAILDAFYRDLAAASEASCGHAGAPLALADNTVMVIDGDTYKDPFDRAGWPDATPGDSSLLYVRSNGFTQPGWFGAIAPTTRTSFDPITGALSATTSNADATAAAFAATLYAIARGNTAEVARFTDAPFAGVIAP